MKNLKSKKKGFTLVELLAVIAILAIIGAVLIPNLTGFKDKAHKSNIQASAKAVVSTAKNYAAEVDKNPLEEGKPLYEYASEHEDFAAMLDLDSMKTRDAEVLLQTPMNCLEKVAKGEVDVKTKDGKVQMTIKGESGSPIESIADNDKVEIAQSLSYKNGGTGGTDENGGND